MPDASRYVYLGSVLTLLVLVEAVNGLRPSKGWAIGLTIALAFSLLANGMIMGEGGKVVRLESATNRAQLAALEVARDEVSDDFIVESAEETTLSNPDMLFDAGTYFDVAESFGSPAYAEGELEGAPEQAREAADLLLARTLPISVWPGFRPVRGGRSPWWKATTTSGVLGVRGDRSERRIGCPGCRRGAGGRLELRRAHGGAA